MRYIIALFSVIFFLIQCKDPDIDRRYGLVDQAVLELFGNKNRDYEYDFFGGEQIYILLDDGMLGCINLRILKHHFVMEGKYSSLSMDQFMSKAIKKEIVFNGVNIRKRCELCLYKCIEYA